MLLLGLMILVTYKGYIIPNTVLGEENNMERRKTRKVKVGTCYVGGDAPVSIQSMTNTDTRDVEATLAQINTLYKAGCEIIRCAVPDMKAAEANKGDLCKSPIPVVADIHFDYRLALKCVENGISVQLELIQVI